ncbi:secretoglobin family 1D member 4-like [Mus caroli]|uniref:Secretoglobin family 1D member 4-like n=1 Tax=Mus caroli TaxID=10089 RepID=A0A6P5P862_MUSCR|nr:secretoglobin family 1D member 4-like [Mus caroli]
MRPIVCLFLIGLALRCYAASDGGLVCKPVLKEMTLFLLGSKESLEENLKSYDPPQEAIDAKLLVKDCVDEISYLDRLKIAGAVVKILGECGMKAWLSKFSPGTPLAK